MKLKLIDAIGAALIAVGVLMTIVNLSATRRVADVESGTIQEIPSVPPVPSMRRAPHDRPI